MKWLIGLMMFLLASPAFALDLNDAAQYQPLFDEIDSGSVSAEDAQKAGAVIGLLRSYLQHESDALQALTTTDDAREAILKAVSPTTQLRAAPLTITK